MYNLGYSEYLLYLVLLIGIIFASIRPYWAFIFSSFLLSSLTWDNAIFTRTNFLGSFLNLSDALIIILILSCILDTKITNLKFPRILLPLLLILTISSLNTLLNFGISYESMRNLRWAINLPIVFFITANLINTNGRAKSFLCALFIGAIICSIQGVFDYYNNKEFYHFIKSGEELRMRYAGSLLGGFFLVASIQKSFVQQSNRLIKIFYFLGTVLFLFCLIVGQWRGKIFSVIISLILLPIFLNRINIYFRSLCTLFLIVVTTLFMLNFIFPWVNIPNLFARTTSTIQYSGINDLDDSSLQRIRQIEREFEEWYKGSWVFGQGLGFTNFLPDAHDKSIAWGHVAYMWYLSSLGLVGFFFFTFYLPLKIFFESKYLVNYSNYEFFNIFGLLGITIVTMEWISQASTTSYIAAGSYVYGFFFGAIWRMSYMSKLSILNKSNNIKNKSNRYYLLDKKYWLKIN